MIDVSFESSNHHCAGSIRIPCPIVVVFQFMLCALLLCSSGGCASLRVHMAYQRPDGLARVGGGTAVSVSIEDQRSDQAITDVVSGARFLTDENIATALQDGLIDSLSASGFTVDPNAPVKCIVQLKNVESLRTSDLAVIWTAELVFRDGDAPAVTRLLRAEEHSDPSLGWRGFSEATNRSLGYLIVQICHNPALLEVARARERWSAPVPSAVAVDPPPPIMPTQPVTITAVPPPLPAAQVRTDAVTPVIPPPAAPETKRPIVESYDSIVARASKALDEGHYEQAIALTSQATQIDPQRHEAYAIAGVALFESGSAGASLLALQTALSRAPDDKKPAIRKMLDTVRQSADTQSNSPGPPSRESP